MDPTTRRIEQAIYDAAKRQAVYAYNVANASTPGFKPVLFEDELEKAKRQYGKENQTFNLEDEMGKIAMNGLKHSSLTKIFSTRYQILRKVVTMGKG
jgi:flagellar basal body rod protein FlgB